MKDKDNMIEKAVESLKQGEVPAGPSKDLTDTTLKKLNQITESSEQIPLNSKRFRITYRFTRIAAVVILFIAIGYATGRLSAPKALDMEQIQSTLEPAIKEKLLDEITQYVQLGVTAGYVQLRDELTEQYQQDLGHAALEILNTSNEITNLRLEELIYAINSAQAQERQWFAAALEELEFNRLEDNNQLGSTFINFAARTEQDLQNTQQNIAFLAKYITDAQSDSVIPNELENSNN